MGKAGARLAVALVALMAGSSCSMELSSRFPLVGRRGNGPPSHAPAHGYRHKHTYYYYPGCYVYFDAERKLYFYIEGGRWRVGTYLPPEIRLDADGVVVLSLETDKPYLHFDAHRAKYPPGQLKNRGGAPGMPLSKSPAPRHGRGKEAS